jgi:hypothetical protein
MKKLKTGVVLGMAFLYTTTFGQAINEAPEQKNVKTYFDILVNVAGTNLNYGDANANVGDYKQSVKGLQLGVSFRAGITPAFSVVSELYYIRKGGNLSNGNPISLTSNALRMHTAELPVLARLHLGQFHLNAGPSIAYNFTGSTNFYNNNGQSAESSTINFRRVEAGVQFGGGFGFMLKQRRVELDVRYAHGLTNMSFNREMYSRAIMVSVRFSKAWKTNPFTKH